MNLVKNRKKDHQYSISRHTRYRLVGKYILNTTPDASKESLYQTA